MSINILDDVFRRLVLVANDYKVLNLTKIKTMITRMPWFTS